jgi:hypothetical protein
MVAECLVAEAESALSTQNSDSSPHTTSVLLLRSYTVFRGREIGELNFAIA